MTVPIPTQIDGSMIVLAAGAAGGALALVFKAMALLEARLAAKRPNMANGYLAKIVEIQVDHGKNEIQALTEIKASLASIADNLRESNTAIAAHMTTNDLAHQALIEQVRETRKDVNRLQGGP